MEKPIEIDISHTVQTSMDDHVEYHVGMPNVNQLERLLREDRMLIIMTGSRSADSNGISTALMVRRFVDSWVAQKPKQRQRCLMRVAMYHIQRYDCPDLIKESVKKVMEQSLENNWWAPPAGTKRGTIRSASPNFTAKVNEEESTGYSLVVDVKYD